MKRIRYIVHNVGTAGGEKVCLEHVSRLVARGWDAEVWTIGWHGSWFDKYIPFKEFGSSELLCQSIRQLSDSHVVATYWTTASWVANNIQNDCKGWYLVQDIDGETYGGDAAGDSYSLGLQPITEGLWVDRQLRQRWNLSPQYISIGIGEKFSPMPIERDNNRIMCQWRTGNRDLKGTALTKEVIRLIHSRRPQSSVVTFGRGEIPKFYGIPHIHIRTPTDEKLRELYCQCGVFLFCSRHEGFGLPAAEALACGAPVVSSHNDGSEEFLFDRETALLGKDASELAPLVTQLQDDRDLAASLAKRGQRFISAYRWDFVLDRLERLFNDDYSCNADNS